MKDYIVRKGCSFFADFKRYDEGAIVQLDAAQVKRYSKLIERFDEDLHADGAPEAPKAIPAAVEALAEDNGSGRSAADVLEEASKPRRRRARKTEGDDAGSE